jgi:hypothetical protein
VKRRFPGVFLLASIILLSSTKAGFCQRSENHHTFADYPGFTELFADTCLDGRDDLPGEKEKLLLRRHQPRFILPPGGEPPLDFYRDYLPCTVMRTWPEKSSVNSEASRDLLREHLRSRIAYLDFDPSCFAEKAPVEPVVYGRVYQEKVRFPLDDGTEERTLTFLKYNILFSRSGLASALPLLHRLMLAFPGLDAEDWHELDNFAAVHVVLDEREKPFAILLAQHNHHRTYLLGKDVNLPPNGRLSFDVAERSNELYLSSSSEEPVRHRVVQWSLHLDYLLSGENRPFFSAHDVTHGVRAGGSEVTCELVFLAPCDPLYRAEMLLGEPRPFMGRYIGRDGPPGSDYYTIPPLYPLGTLLKFSYLQDGDAMDISLVRESVDTGKDTIRIERIVEHGGRSLYRDWKKIAESKKN